MRGTISIPTFVTGKTFMLTVFLVAVMLMVVGTAEETINIELVEMTRLYGDIMADFLINSPNWYSIDRLTSGSANAELFGIGYGCTHINQFGTGATLLPEMFVGFTDGSAYVQNCDDVGKLKGDGSTFGDINERVCYSVPSPPNRPLLNLPNRLKCKNPIGFTNEFYVPSDCGCLAWEETVDGETVVHPGIVDKTKLDDNQANCANHPLPFCMDAAGYFWRVEVSDDTGASWTFGWHSDLVQAPDATVKKVIGIYDPDTGRIRAGKLELTIQTSELRSKRRIIYPEEGEEDIAFMDPYE